MRRTRRTQILIRWLHMSFIATVALGAVGHAQAQAPYALGDDLCLDISGTLPDYNTKLPTAAAGAPRPMYVRTLTTLCNDGTPAVMYLRPAPAGSLNADKWVVMLDGGGNCSTADACLERWCSYSGDVVDYAGKMSSAQAPAAIDPPEGIQSRSAVNKFNDWNHVFVHYCTSDVYVGSAATKTISPDPAGLYAGFDYDIQFNGEALVNEVFDTLRNGPTFPDIGLLGTEVPDLADGTLLLAAESAGEAGRRSHIDRIAALLAGDGVEVLGVGDASFGMAMYDPIVLNWAGTVYADYNDLMTTEVEPSYRNFWEVDDTALDASCLASGVLDYFCMDSVYLAINENSTPSFIRADLTDPTGSSPVAWGFVADHFEWANTIAAQFSQLPAGWGWFGPHCDKHVQIQGPGFAKTSMKNGTGTTFHDALHRWVFNLAGTKRERQSDANGAAPYDTSRRCN